MGPPKDDPFARKAIDLAGPLRKSDTHTMGPFAPKGTSPGRPKKASSDHELRSPSLGVSVMNSTTSKLLEMGVGALPPEPIQPVTAASGAALNLPPDAHPRARFVFRAARWNKRLGPRSDRWQRKPLVRPRGLRRYSATQTPSRQANDLHCELLWHTSPLPRSLNKHAPSSQRKESHWRSSAQDAPPGRSSGRQSPSMHT